MANYNYFATTHSWKEASNKIFNRWSLGASGSSNNLQLHYRFWRTAKVVKELRCSLPFVNDLTAQLHKSMMASGTSPQSSATLQQSLLEQAFVTTSCLAVHHRQTCDQQIFFPAPIEDASLWSIERTQSCNEKRSFPVGLKHLGSFHHHTQKSHRRYRGRCKFWKELHWGVRIMAIVLNALAPLHQMTHVPSCLRGQR